MEMDLVYYMGCHARSLCVCALLSRKAILQICRTRDTSYCTAAYIIHIPATYIYTGLPAPNQLYADWGLGAVSVQQQNARFLVNPCRPPTTRVQGTLKPLSSPNNKKVFSCPPSHPPPCLPSVPLLRGLGWMKANGMQGYSAISTYPTSPSKW